jgi:PBSX family phage terminase large subunit
MRNIWGSELVGEINSQNKCKLFGEVCYCLGAEKVSQVSKLRGSSIKYCYGDEMADWNEEVFEILKSRLDKPYSCLDGALNPQDPNHWLKKFLESDADIYCQKYTIFDNPFLPQEFITNLCKEYSGSVYYRRYILGEWALAEGLVYPMFSREKHIIHEPATYNSRNVYLVSIDYGTVNPFAVGLWEYNKAKQKATMIKELYYSGRDTGKRVDDEAYYKMLLDLIGDLPVQTVIVDPSAASFIETVKKYGKFIVKGADNDVLNGIQYTTKFLNANVIQFNDSCENMFKELEGYAWDEKAGEDKVIKENDHLCDQLRYFVMTFLRKELRYII